MAGKAIEELKNNNSLPEKTIEKLTFAIKETIKKIVEGQQVTEDTVKQLIAKKKNPKSKKQEQNFEHFAPAVLQACENARSVLLQWYKLKFNFGGKDSDNPDERFVDGFFKRTGSACENAPCVLLQMINKLRLDFCGKDPDNHDKQLVARFCKHARSTNWG